MILKLAILYDEFFYVLYCKYTLEADTFLLF